MTSGELSVAERAVIGECLACVASGEVILEDEEFETVFGIQFSELTSVAAAWPNVDESTEQVFLAINGSLNNLLGYPHGKMGEWSRYISVPPSEVSRIYAKWRGKPIRS
jgi:hypothetical protein